MSQPPALPDNAAPAFIAALLDETLISEEALYASLAANLPGHEACGSDLIEQGRAAFRKARGGLQRKQCSKLHEACDYLFLARGWLQVRGAAA